MGFHIQQISVKIYALSKKFDRLLCMNKMFDASSVQDMCSIYASPMHAFVECLCVGKSDCITEQVNAAQEFPLTSNPYSNTCNHI